MLRHYLVRRAVFITSLSLTTAVLAQGTPQQLNKAAAIPAAATFKNATLGAAIAPTADLRILAARATHPREMRCIGINRQNDAIGVKTDADGTMIQVNCRDSEIDGKGGLGILQQAIFALPNFNSPQFSQRWHDRATACVTAFNAYKSKPSIYAFVIKRDGFNLTCQARDVTTLRFANAPIIPNVMVAPKDLKTNVLAKVPVGPTPTPSPTNANAPKVMSGSTENGFLAKRIDRLIDGVSYIDYDRPFYRNDLGGPASLALVTAQKPAGNYAIVQIFAKAPEGLAACANYDQTPGILGGIAAKITASYPINASNANGKIEIDAIAKAGGPKITSGYVTLFTITPKDLDSIQKLLPAGDGSASLRAVVGTLAASKNGMPGFTCGSAPSAIAEMLYGTSASQQASADVAKGVAAAAAAKAKAEQDYKAGVAALRAQHANDMPVHLSLIGYVPPYKERPGLLQSTVVDNPKSSTDYIKSYSLSLKAHGRTYNVNGDKMAGFPWPKAHQNGWFEGCVYDPGRMLFVYDDYIKRYEKNMPPGWGNKIVWILDNISKVYATVKDVVIQTASYLGTAGECPFKPEFGGQVYDLSKTPNACTAFRQGLSIALEGAMTSVGLPPALPSASNIVEEGAEYVAGYAVKQAFAKIGGTTTAQSVGAKITETIGEQAYDSLKDEAKDALRKKFEKEIIHRANVSSCGTAVGQPGDKSEFDSRGCILSPESILNFSKAETRLKGQEDHALFWLKAVPNPQAARDSAGKLVRPEVRIRIVSSVSNFGTNGEDGKKYAAQMKNKMNGQSLLDNRILKVFDTATGKLDGRIVPKSGLEVPVSAPFAPLEQWRHAYQSTGVCNHAFEASCLAGGAYGTHRRALLFGTVDFDINVEFDVPAPPALQALCKMAQIQGDCSKVSIVKDIAERKAVNASHPIAGLDFGVPTLAGKNAIKACPGFVTAINAEDGLPEVNIGFDSTKAELELE
jgi:hypothetical protein